MKKERIFYLDFVRAIATISIIFTHYNALFIYNTSVPMPQKAILTLTVGNIYIGGWGVSLFLIISGAALMYVYENYLDVLTFWKKRFINIYPMFWIAYIGAMLFNFYRFGSIDTSIGKWRYIFSFLGIDQYLGVYEIPGFSLVGEWFLGYIIIIYIIFPILRKGVNDFPIILAILAVLMYIVSLICNSKDVSLFVKLPEFLFGMYFIKFVKRPNWKMALLSFVIVILNALIKPEINSVIQCTYVGTASFVCLAYVSEFLKFEIVQKICKLICKYSYPCFIVHHFIIYRMVEKFNLDNITMGQNYLLFACCVVVIVFFSYLLLHVNDKVMQVVKKEEK